MDVIMKAWSVFFNSGWLHGQVPSKIDCFKAGFEAGLNASIDKEIEKKTVPEIIKDWEDRLKTEKETEAQYW